MSDVLHIETDHRGVQTLRMQRADKHNALDPELIDALTHALNDAAHNQDIRVLILTGEGSSFCSGADLSWMRASVDYTEQQNREDAARLATLMRSLALSPKPTIARINGPAFGGGVGLIACCDIAISIDSAVFAFSETRLGLVPAVISPYILMSIGPRQARKLFMTAERFNAQQALDWQLIHHCANQASIDDVIAEHIQHLLKAGPEALKHCKELVPLLNNETLDQQLIQLIAALRSSPEAQEGLQAFLEKRPPQWTYQSLRKE